MELSAPRNMGPETGEGFPAQQTILVTGIESGQVWISLPSAGTLWVGYEYAQSPATLMELWHQGGQTETIKPGQRTFTVGAGDAIVYQLASPDQAVKIGWAYQ